MGFLQAVLGGLFTILGAASLFFMAYKAMMIGNDVAEMKELLRKMQTGDTGAVPGPKPLPSSAGLNSNSEEAYLAALNSYEPAMPAAEPVAPPKPQREFVLPPPISRRLDAERGIRRESNNDDSRLRY